MVKKNWKIIVKQRNFVYETNESQQQHHQPTATKANNHPGDTTKKFIKIGQPV